MEELRFTKIRTLGTTAELKVREGHYATKNAHVNYYADLTTLKTRLSDAKEIARTLTKKYTSETIVDTIICLECTECIGALLANEMIKEGFKTTNKHKSIYVESPEYNSKGQVIFRDNIVPIIKNKNILILASNITTGGTVARAIEGIEFYGGVLTGIAAVFSVHREIAGAEVRSVFGRKDLPEYAYYDFKDCPMCKEGRRLDALVNTYGYSIL